MLLLSGLASAPPPRSLTPTCTLRPHPGGSSASPVLALRNPLGAWSAGHRSSVGPWAPPGASAHLRSRLELGAGSRPQGRLGQADRALLCSAVPATPAQDAPAQDEGEGGRGGARPVPAVGREPQAALSPLVLHDATPAMSPLPVSPWAPGGLCRTCAEPLSTLCCASCLPAHPPPGDGGAQGASARRLRFSRPCRFPPCSTGREVSHRRGWSWLTVIASRLLRDLWLLRPRQPWVECPVSDLADLHGCCHGCGFKTQGSGLLGLPQLVSGGVGVHTQACGSRALTDARPQGTLASGPSEAFCL